MKYLKKFNESYHNEEITKADYFHLMGDTYDPLLKKTKRFDQLEIDKIKSLCEPFRLSVISVTGARFMSIFLRNTPKVSIEKLDDEWFVCFYINENRYVKCDTIDGLLQELKRYIDYNELSKTI